MLLIGVVSRVQAGSKLSSVPGDAHGQITSGNGTGKCRLEAGVDSERALPRRALGRSLGQHWNTPG